MPKFSVAIIMAATALTLSSCISTEKSFSGTLKTSTAMAGQTAAAPVTHAAARVVTFGKMPAAPWPTWSQDGTSPPSYRFYEPDDGIPSFGPFSLFSKLGTAAEKLENAFGNLGDREVFCVDSRKVAGIHKLLSGRSDRMTAMEAYRLGDFRTAKNLAMNDVRTSAARHGQTTAPYALTLARAATVHADSALPKDEAKAHELWQEATDILRRVGTPEQQAAVALDYARFLLDRRRPNEAVIVLDQIAEDVLKEERDRMRVLTLRARLAAEKGRVMDALRWFDTAFTYWESLEDHGDEAGRSLASAILGQVSSDEEMFTPPSLEASRVLAYAAEILRGTGRLDEARAMTDAAIVKTRANETCMAPERVRFVGLRGIIRLESGDLDGAAEDADRVARMTRWNHGYYTQYSADGRYLGGLVAAREKNLDEAELLLRNALWIWSDAGGRADNIRASVALANLYRANGESAAADWYLRSAVAGAESLSDGGAAATADLARRIKRSAYLSLMWQALDRGQDPASSSVAFQAAQRALEGPVQAVAAAAATRLAGRDSDLGDLLLTQARLEQDVARLERQALDSALGGTTEMMQQMAKTEAEDRKPSGPFGLFGGNRQPAQVSTAPNPFMFGGGMQAQMETAMASMPPEYRAQLKAVMGEAMPGATQTGGITARRAELERVRTQIADRLGDERTVLPPVAPADVQAGLQPGEALVMLVTDSEETAVFAVTPSAMQVARVELNSRQVRRLVEDLRRPLEAKTGDFDNTAAAALHDMLLKPVSATLAGAETLFLVKDGPLSTLPFAVLKPEGAAGPWLVEKHALLTLPTVSALQAGTRTASELGKVRLLGVGNPVLDDLKRAAQEVSGGLVLRGLGDVTGSARSVQTLPSLPETGNELRHLAQALAPDAHTVLVREDATESRFLASRPENFDVLAFSTHAVIPGEVLETQEAAIVLTPEADGPTGNATTADGLLTTSEIASLDLDADWVVLSACNTAASGDSEGGNALSGLAKAFMMSGTGSLMVSHWYVDSKATEKLVTTTAANMGSGMPRHDALRKAMMEVMAMPKHSHPRSWAPFVMVGGA